MTHARPPRTLFRLLAALLLLALGPALAQSTTNST